MEPWLDGPWSVRLARGTRGRSALEVYNRGLLVDVLVDAQLARRVLRGARRGEGTALAWGLRTPDGGLPAVRFGELTVRPRPVGEAFWVAQAPLDGSWVSADAERVRVRAGWSR
ncbi:hypothetical protein [Streptacidiphilus monticola]|jgi:hypothetical protein|uniref:Uncharacterized protein n=1 Tax=Streptacidiphilus monticola TaxID=2161674 RepID=A0ABW1G833_9ACTN